MSPDPHPRYVVREITGYAMNASRWPAPTTSVRVADTWNCWRSVADLPSEDRRSFGQHYRTRRRIADEIAARLNAEHDAWLAAG